MCQSCGAIVGGGQSQCAVCGATTTSQGTPQRSRPVVDHETLRFARAILNRPNKFTIILLIANFFVFMMMWESSGMSSQALWVFPEPVLIAYGAKLNILISEYHQWWRFVTPMFVHVGLLHLLINMYSLWIIGPYVEKLYGSAKFVVFWVVTGVAGVVASYLTVVGPDNPLSAGGRFLFKTIDAPSAGASGALFGLVGVLFVFGIKFRRELPEGFKRAFGMGMLPIIVINLFIGYLGRGLIDNAAHLGGLIAGAALAIFVDYRRPGERKGIAITWQILRAAAIAVVAISLLEVARHFNAQIQVPAVAAETSNSSAVDDFVNHSKVMNEAQETLNKAIQKGDRSGVDNAIKGIEAAPQLDDEAQKLNQRMKDLLIRSKELDAVRGESNSPLSKNAESEQEALITDSEAWKRDYEKWLKTSAGKFNGLGDLMKPKPSAQ